MVRVVTARGSIRARRRTPPADQAGSEAQQRFGYAPLTSEVKAGILAGNATRLYGIDPAGTRCSTTSADRAALRADPPSDDVLLGPLTTAQARRVFAVDHPWF